MRTDDEAVGGGRRRRLGEAIGRANVLLAEDDPATAEILAGMLAGDGHRVTCVESGSLAVGALRTEQIDLVLLDIMMPGLDGLEVCRHIRQDLGLRDLPVIIVTAVHDRDARVRGKEAGADEYLTKPVDPIELLARVRSLLDAKAYHDLLRRQREDLEARLDDARELLVRAERLATLGTLAAGVGHELRGVLAVHRGALQGLRADAEAGQAPRPEDLAALTWADAQVDLHAGHLLGLARPEDPEGAPVDVSEVVRDVFAMLRVAGRTRGVLARCSTRGKVVSQMGRVRLEQLFLNLVGNAADAVAETGRGQGHVEVRLRGLPSGRIRCEVADDGAGIPPEHSERLFEPYFSTKPPGRGTGLGLLVSRRIVESHGGALEIVGRPVGGALVRFDLPGVA